MGLVDRLFGLVFGGSNGNVIKETVEVFRENAEASAERQAAVQVEALRQFASEFARPKQSFFDRAMDGLNRIPRPAMALGTLGLFVAAMVDPVWFSSRMQGIALVPEPLWWLLGAVVSFYFGARHQLKGQEFQRSMAEMLARVPKVVENSKALKELAEPDPLPLEEPEPEPAPKATQASFPDNAALRDWAGQKD
ncbi:MAG: holin family protein [Pseudomonadota bacterium]